MVYGLWERVGGWGRAGHEVDKWHVKGTEDAASLLALSGRLQFTVRRHKFKTDSLLTGDEFFSSD